jgi:hypothetical protein
MTWGVIFVLVLIFGIPIWISLKAKSLDVFPYRWATFVAFWLAIGTVTMLFRIMVARQATTAMTYLFLAVLGALASVGLFRRAKLGVVFLIAHHTVIFLAPLIPGASYVLISAMFWLILLIANILYFKKRWKYMGSGWLALILPLPKEES